MNNMSSRTHTVYRLTSRTGFDGLEAFQEPLPSAGKHEILVRVRSVALNFRDIAIAKGIFPLPVKDNVVPCSDMAGEVVQVGEGVREFAIGDHVTAPVSLIVLYGPVKDEDNSLGGSVDGVLREYIVLPAHATIKLPKSSSHSFTEWAAMVTTAYTVWNAFYGSIPLRPGQTVLVLGMIQPTLSTRPNVASILTLCDFRNRRRISDRSDFRKSGRRNHHRHLVERREAPTHAIKIWRRLYGELQDNSKMV